MKNLTLGVFLLAILFVLPFSGCTVKTSIGGGSPAGDSTAASGGEATAGTPEEAIKALIEKQVAAMNKGDVEGYLSTLDPGSTLYELNKALYEPLLSQYKFEVTLEKFEIVDVKENTATVKKVLVTKKVSGPDFVDNRTEIEDKLVKKEDGWKVNESTPGKVEELK